MSEVPPAVPDNSAISALRTHVATLEADLSKTKIAHNTTEAERAALLAQKENLESQLATANAEVAKKVALETRATELETRFADLVATQLLTFPENKRTDVTTLIEGLTPDKQLDKLKALSSLIEVVATPPPGNPPAPPLHGPAGPPKEGDPPQTDPNDKLADLKAIVARGGDPLATLKLST